MSVEFIVLFIIALPFIAAFFVKKEYSVQSEIKIDRPSPMVFDYLKYLKNHESFSKWGKSDAHVIKQYHGTDGTVGFIASWESRNKQVGKGQQQIKKISIGKRIDFELVFIKPYSSIAHSYLIIDAVSRNETIVTWGFDSKMSYPMNLMLLFNIKKVIGKDLSSGLSSLKQELERKDLTPGKVNSGKGTI